MLQVKIKQIQSRSEGWLLPAGLIQGCSGVSVLLQRLHLNLSTPASWKAALAEEQSLPCSSPWGRLAGWYGLALTPRAVQLCGQPQWGLVFFPTMTCRCCILQSGGIAQECSSNASPPLAQLRACFTALQGCQAGWTTSMLRGIGTAGSTALAWVARPGVRSEGAASLLIGPHGAQCLRY